MKTSTITTDGLVLKRGQTNRTRHVLCAVVSFALLLCASTGWSAAFTSAASGDWNLGATWGNAGNVEGTDFPGASDTVTNRAGDSVTVTADAAATSITFNNISASAATLTVNASVTLNVSVGITLQNSATANTAATITGAGTINCASVTVGGTTTPTGGVDTATLTSTISTLAISGNLAITGQDSGVNDNNPVFAVESGAVSVGGSVVFTQPTGSSATLTLATGAQAGTLTLSGATPFSGTGTFTATGTGATVDYARSGAQTVNPVAYRNLTLSGTGAGNTKTLTSLTTVNGNLILSGTATATTAATILIGGNLSIGDGATFMAATALTVTGTTTVGGGTSGNLTISSTTGIKIFTGLVTINTGGTWNNSVNEDVTFRGGITSAPTFTGGSGQHTFDTASQTLTGTFSIPNVTVTGAAVMLTNTGTLTVSTALSGTGGLMQGTGATLNIGGTSGITTLAAAASPNDVNYAGAAQTVKAANYYNLALSGTGAKTLGGNIDVAGTATVNSGVMLNCGASVVSGAGTFTLSSGATLGIGSTAGIAASGATGNIQTTTRNFDSGANYTYNGTANQVAGDGLPPTLNNLTNANTAAVVTLSGPTTVNGALAISASANLSDGGFTLTAKTTVANLGTHSSTGSGKILFNGSAAQGFGGVYGNMELNNTAGSSLIAVTTINGNLTLTAGTFTAGLNLTVSGTTSISGTLALTAGATKTFGNVIINLGGTWNNSGNLDVSIKGNFQNDGTFTPGTSAAVYTFNGTSSQNISGSVTPSFVTLTINNTAAEVTVSANFNVSGTMTVSTVFNPGTSTVINSAITQGTLTGSGTIKVTRTAATADLVNQYKFTTRTLTSMTVDYAGTDAQTVNVPSTSYGALKISGSGTKTLEGDMAVTGVLSLTSGSLSIGANTFTLNAGITTTGGSLIGGANSSINFATAGGGTATLPSVSSGLNNLTVNRTAGITLGGPVSVVGTLTLTAGVVTVGSNLTMGDGATISRAAGSLSAAPSFGGSVNVIYISGTAVTTGPEIPTSSSVLKNLTVANATGSGVTLGTPVTVNGNLDYTGGELNTSVSGHSLTVVSNLVGGSTGLLLANSSIITIGGNFTGTDTITPGTSTVVLNGTNQSLRAGPFYNLTLAGTGTKTPTAAIVVNANGTFTIGADTTFDVAAFTTHTVAGESSLVVNGTLDFTDASGLIRSGTSGTSTLTVGSSGLIRTIDSLGIGPVANASFTLQTGGSWGMNSISTSGAVEYYRSTTSGQTVTDRDYNNLVISGATQVKTWTIAATRTVNGNVTINTSAPFTLTGAQTLNVKGNWTHSGGTFTHTGGTVSMNGTSVQTVSGSSTTGFNSLIVDNATGVLVNSTASTAGGCTVNSGAILGGTGTLNGPVTVNGTVAPGSSIGTFTLGNAPALNGAVVVEINQTNVQTADLLTLTSGALGYGSTLIVTNLGPAPTNGSVFTLFNASTYSGGFASLTLPPGGTNHWKTNNLTVNGTISFTNNTPTARAVTNTVNQFSAITVTNNPGKNPLATDADGDTLTYAVLIQPTNGSAVATASGIIYTNTAGITNVFDTLTYTVSDGVGGVTNNTMTFWIQSQLGFNLISATADGGFAYLTYLGIPGQTYVSERCTNLVTLNWEPVATNTAQTVSDPYPGRVFFTNAIVPPASFFRTQP